MSFNTSPGRAEYTAGAGQTIFPFSFKIFAATDLKVYQTPADQDADDVNDKLTLTTDYTVTINGDLGGNITLVTPPPVNDGITLVRDLPIERPTEYQDNGDLLGSTLNQDQDYQTYLIADKDVANSRFITIPESSQGIDLNLPSPNALDVIGWNQNATGLTNFTIGTANTFINILNVDSIAELILVNSLLYSTVNVRGYYTPNDGGGGIFNYDATQSAVNNGGTVINGWVRQYSGPVNVKWFGAKGDGVTDDTVSLQSAHNINAQINYTSGNFLITSPIAITITGQRIIGSGWGNSSTGATSRVFSALDIELFIVSSTFVHFEGFRFDSTVANLSKPHIHFAGDAFSSVSFCRFDAVENFVAVGGGILIDDGAGGIGGSVALINNINISHGSITVKRSDVHIKNSWIWANSRPYGITAIGGVGNLVIEGCDVLPPQTSVTGRKAGIYLSGSLSNPRVLGCNLDGNSSLSTGTGLLAENGVLGLIISGGYSFGHNEDSIVLDSIIAPIITGVSFKNNNISGTGATDITLRDTFAQPLEKPLVQACSFVQTATITGTLGATVKLTAGTSRKGVRIIDNAIHQPGAGGGYTDIEIALEDGAFTGVFQGSLKGNVGTRRHYQASGVKSIITDDTFETISYPVTLAYAPRLDQINLSFASTANGVNDYRFNSAGLPTASAMGLGFPAVHPAFDLYYSIEL